MDTLWLASTSCPFLPAAFLSLLDHGNGDLEVLRVRGVDQGAIADLTGELEHLGALGADIDGDALLTGQGDAGELRTVVVEELHLAGLLDLFACAEAAELDDAFLQAGDGLRALDRELRQSRKVAGTDAENGASVAASRSACT